MSATSFPVGSTFGDGEYQIVDRLRGTASGGQYLGIGPLGYCLVSVSRRISVGYADAARLLALPLDGVASLTYVGPLEGTDEAIDAIAETMPGGKPTSQGVPIEQALLFAAHTAELAARAHKLQVVLGGLRPEFIFVEERPERISGFAPRGERFIALGSTPLDAGGYPFDRVFSAPEQIFAGLAIEATEAIDVFMLATTIATWFGQHPFGEMRPAQVRAIVSGTPGLDHVPAPVSALLAPALSVDPQARPSMRALADGLRSLLRSR